MNGKSRWKTANTNDAAITQPRAQSKRREKFLTSDWLKFQIMSPDKRYGQDTHWAESQKIPKQGGGALEISSSL